MDSCWQLRPRWQRELKPEVLVDLDPIPDDGQAHLSSNGKQRRNLDVVPLQYARFWEQDMSMELNLANKDLSARASL